jgi:hypothetical protein
MQELCLGLQGLAKERSIKFTVEKLLAHDQRGGAAALLGSGQLSSCNRRRAGRTGQAMDTSRS